MACSALFSRALQREALCSHERQRNYAQESIADFEVFVHKKLPMFMSECASIDVPTPNEKERHVLTHRNVAMVRPSAPNAEDVARGRKFSATRDPQLRVLPYETRIRKLSHVADVVCDVLYTAYDLIERPDGTIEERLKAPPVSYRELPLFQLPIMTKSSLCNLSDADPTNPARRFEADEDAGGLFEHRGNRKKIALIKEKRQNVPLTTGAVGGKVRVELRSNRVDEKVRHSSTLYVNLVPAPITAGVSNKRSRTATMTASAAASVNVSLPLSAAVPLSVPAAAQASTLPLHASLLKQKEGSRAAQVAGTSTSTGTGTSTGTDIGIDVNVDADADAKCIGLAPGHVAGTMLGSASYTVIVAVSSYLDKLPGAAVFRLLDIHDRDTMLDFIFPARLDPTAAPPPDEAVRALDAMFLNPLMSAPMEEIYVAATASDSMFNDKKRRGKAITLDDRKTQTMQCIHGELAPQVGFAPPLLSTPTHLAKIRMKKALVLGWCIRDAVLKHLGIEEFMNVDFEGLKYILPGSDVLGRSAKQRWINFCKTLRKRVFNELKNRKPTDPLPDLSHVYQRTDAMSHGLAKMMSDGVTTVQKSNVSSIPAIQNITATNMLGMMTELDRVRTPQNAVGRYDQLRQVTDEQLGTICPIETPEGETVGLVQNLSIFAHRRLGIDVETLTTLVLSLGSFCARTRRQSLRPASRLKPHQSPPSSLKAFSESKLLCSAFVRPLESLSDFIPPVSAASACAADASVTCGDDDTPMGPTVTVYVNWDPVAVTNFPTQLADAVRMARRHAFVPYDTTVVVNSWGVLICADEGVLTTPLVVLENMPLMSACVAECQADKTVELWPTLVKRGVVEYMCAWELHSSNTRVALHTTAVDAWMARVAAGTDVLLNGQKETPFTHLLPHPQALLGTCAAMVPFLSDMPAARGTYQAGMGKQADGWIKSNIFLCADVPISRILLYPQKAMCVTDVEVAKGMDQYPAGFMAMLCIRAAPDNRGLTGKNQEDSVVVNQDFVERGGARTCTQKVYTLCARTKGNADAEFFRHPLMAVFDATKKTVLKTVGLRSGANYDTVDSEGLPAVGTRLKNGDCLIGRVIVVKERGVGGDADRFVARDMSAFLRCSAHEVHVVKDVIVTTNREGQRMVRVVTISHHSLRPGDKMACLTPDHEVLSKTRGWISIADVTLEDDIAILRPSSCTMGFAKPTALHSYECNEPLYEVETCDVSLRTTREHRMWVQERNPYFSSDDDGAVEHVVDRLEGWSRFDEAAAAEAAEERKGRIRDSPFSCWRPFCFVTAKNVVHHDRARYLTRAPWTNEDMDEATIERLGERDAARQWAFAEVSRDRKAGAINGFSSKAYDGKVYCVSVPTQIFLVRRNGKTCFTGNSRHGQKFTVGALTRAVNLPYVMSTGMPPDICASLTCMNSRNTAAFVEEGVKSQLGLKKGVIQDATPYEAKDPRATLDELVASGCAQKETLVDGTTGQVCREDCWMIPVFIQRLIHEAADKLGVRARGARTAVTRQAVEGRAQTGGLRWGGMEGEAAIAHGAAYFLHDRTVKCADGADVPVCTQCGQVAEKVSDSIAEVSAKIAAERAAAADFSPSATATASATNGHPLSNCLPCRICGSSDIVMQSSLWCWAGPSLTTLASLGIQARHRYDDARDGEESDLDYDGDVIPLELVCGKHDPSDLVVYDSAPATSSIPKRKRSAKQASKAPSKDSRKHSLVALAGTKRKQRRESIGSEVGSRDFAAEPAKEEECEKDDEDEYNDDDEDEHDNEHEKEDEDEDDYEKEEEEKEEADSVVSDESDQGFRRRRVPHRRRSGARKS